MAKLALKKEYKPYKEYRDSGVEWLGDIPELWEPRKIMTLFDFSNEKGFEDDYEALSVTYGGIKKQLENAAKVADGSVRKLVRKNDIVINNRSDRKGAVGVSEYEGVVSLVYSVLRPRDTNLYHSGYYHHLLRSNIFSEEFYRWGRGIVDDLWTTRSGEMKRIIVPLPPKEEQEKIADFLDEKISLIDSIIGKKKILIELLREKRSAVINHAVTKGLDPKAELIDSGIVWIGETPKDWVVMTLKSFGKAIIGLTYSPENIVSENGTAVLRSSNVKDGQTIMKDVVYVDKKISKKLTLKKNDILICSRNGSKKLIGKNAKIGDDLVGQTFGAFMTVYRSNNNNFVYWFLNSNIFLAQTELFISSTINQLTIDSLKNLKISLPDEDTQKEVTAYLAKRDPEFREAVGSVEKSIEKLQEFKSSLISHAVTGKIKI